MTKKQSGHTPAGMDRLKKNLMIEYSFSMANLQDIITVFEAAVIALICGLMAVVEVLV
jgi:hypothetical protein